MPRGFETEDGPQSEFAYLYGTRESAGGYQERTLADARNSAATVRFGEHESPGSPMTHRACRSLSRQVLLVRPGVTRPSDLAAWLIDRSVGVLNVAGNRESTQSESASGSSDSWL